MVKELSFSLRVEGCSARVRHCGAERPPAQLHRYIGPAPSAAERQAFPACRPGRPQDLHNAVYVGSAAMEAYHREANQDLHVTVSPWGSEEPATQTRTVSFTMPIKAPDFIKRSIGADRMRVQESQRLAWGADGKQRSFTVCSEPVLEVGMQGLGVYGG